MSTPHSGDTYEARNVPVADLGAALAAPSDMVLLRECGHVPENTPSFTPWSRSSCVSEGHSLRPLSPPCTSWTMQFLATALSIVMPTCPCEAPYGAVRHHHLAPGPGVDCVLGFSGRGLDVLPRCRLLRPGWGGFRVVGYSDSAACMQRIAARVLGTPM